MLDTPKKLPSFSNEPQKFADMTLFVGKDGLTLHIPSDCEFLMHRDAPIENTVRYYAGYVERETSTFMKLGEAQMRTLETYYRVNEKTPPSLTDDERKKRVLAYARYFAQRHAENCGDSHDLSDEFCAAATKLGEALHARAEAGMKTITIINSGDPAEKFMMPKHG